ncbi:MAG: hypothetical protein ACI9MC_001645 [Kiritimatiellia bacterium]|jgi:hypothetical protein
MHRALPLLFVCACANPPNPPPPPPAPTSEVIPVTTITAESSSFLSDTTGDYVASNVIDDKSDTAWCEGTKGLGAGETLTLTLAKTMNIESIEIDGGFFKDDRTLTNNGRPRKMTVTSDQGWSVEVAFPFVPLREHHAKEMVVKSTLVSGGGQAKQLVFTLVEADAGRFTKDTCISAIVLRKKL